MAVACNFKTSAASTKAFFRKNELIDKYLNILNLNEFRKANTKWSNYSKQQYGIEGRLFLEENNGTKAIPNQELFKQIDSTKNINYQLDNNQKEKPNSQIESKIKNWLEKVGIEYKPTNKILDTNGNEVNAIAKADILNKTIEVIEGKRDITTLPEEAGHFLVELLGENHPLYQKMFKEITQYQVYQDVLNSPYVDLYQNDEKFLKKEAIGKLIAQHIISKETGTELPEKIQKIETWFGHIWNYLKSKLKNLINSTYREDINSFSEASKIITEGRTEELFDIKNLNNKYDNIFYELDEIPQKDIIEKLKNVGITYDPKTKKYIQNNREVDKRVSNLVKDYYKKRFKNPLEEETDKSKLLALKGTVIHAYNQVIMNKIISEKSFTKKEIEDEVLLAVSELPEIAEKQVDFIRLKPNDYNELINLSKQLYNRIQEHQNQINKQTGREDKPVILTEQILYDNKKDEAGTVDLLVVYSNGSSSIYDYKGINFVTKGNKVISDIPIYKQEAYDIQIAEYMDLLRDNFGISSFIETRVIPVNLQLNANNENGFFKVQAGTKDKEGDYREYLEELPVANELTGIEEIDEQLKKMFALRDLEKAKLNKDSKNSILKARVEKLNTSIKKLQINKDTRYAFTEVQSIINEYNKRKILYKESKDSFSLEDIKDYEEYLLVYQDFFQQAIDIELNKEENKDLQDKIEGQYYKLDKHINLTLKDLGNKRLEILKENFNKDMQEVGKEPSWLETYFNKLSEFSRNQFKALSQLVRDGEYEVRENVNKVKELLEPKQEVLKKWADSKGISLQQAYNKIYDSETGQLKRKFNSIYLDEKKEAIKKEDYKWFLDNTQIELVGEDNLKYSDFEIQTKFEEIKKKQFELIDRNFPGEINDKLREKYKLNWEAKHDITVNPSAIFKQPYFIKPKEDERFYTETWKELNLSGNEPLLDIYNTFIELNREFSKVTGKDLSDYNVAEVQKDMIDMLATNGVGGLSGIKDYINNTFEVQQQDNLLGSGNIDPNTGEYIHSIPFLFTSDLTQSITEKEYQKLKQEVLKKHTDEKSVIFKDELKKEVLKFQREKGLKTKSSDLGRSFILLAEAAYSHAYLSNTLETVKALRTTLLTTGTTLTDSTNKTFIDKYTKKVMSKLGASNSEIEIFDKYVDLYYYGRKIQNKDILIEKESTEISELLGEKRAYSSNKMLRGVMSYVSAKALGLSWVAGVGSAIGASQNLLIQASEGKFFNSKEVRDSGKLLMKGDTKANLLTKYFESYSKDLTYEKANEMSASKLSKVFTQDNLYIMMRKPDEAIDKLIMLSVLQHYGLKEGKIEKLSKLPEGSKSLYELSDIKDDKIVIERLSKDNYIMVRNIMQKASSKIKGTIPEADQNLIGTNIYTAMLMQFKNWIPQMVKDRGQTLTYDEDTNDLEVGRFRVFFGEFTEKGLLPKLNAFKETLFEVAAFGKYNRYGNGKISSVAQKYYDKFIAENPNLADKISIEDFIELRKQKLQGMARELRGYLGLFLLVALTKAAIPDDDDENSINTFIAQNAYKMSNRGLLELSFFLNPSSFTQIAKRPFATLSLFDDLTKVVKNTVQETVETTGIKEENKSDKTPYGYYSSKLIPGSRVFLDIFDFFDNFKTQ